MPNNKQTKSLEETVFELLKEKGLTAAFAESCTGGFLAKRITDIAGSSRVFNGGVVVYSDDAKAKLLGIDPQLIAEKTAVSEEVGREMALRVREKLGADIGIGITGEAGPLSSGEHPVGDVYISLADEKGVFCKLYALGNTRAQVRLGAVETALELIIKRLSNIPLE